jgi:hypothetical protein
MFTQCPEVVAQSKSTAYSSILKAAALTALTCSPSTVIADAG